MNASSLKPRGHAYHKPPARRETFRPDRYSHRERLRRSSLRRALRAWWDNATPLERILRLWWWCFCALIGLTFGAMATLLLAALVIALT